MNGPVAIRTHGRIALAAVDHPPVNALSHAVRAGLVAAIDRIDASADFDALVIACEGKTFFSGADIKEFGKPMAPPLLGELIERIERCAKPVVAAIHGKALGGGLEVALGCHYRVAARDAKIALPEVKLGIIPGAGGTQRLPRLVGLAAAIRMIAEGNEMPAVEAHTLGAIDALVDGDVVQGALEFTSRVLAESAPLRRTGELAPPPAEPALTAEARKNLGRKLRGQAAPQAAVDAVELMHRFPLAEALRAERALCLKLLDSPQSKALRHVFAAERRIARVPGMPETVQARAVQTVGVVGLGVMGAGIAQVLANAGLDVVAIARSTASLDRAMTGIRKAYAAQVTKGQIGQSVADCRLAAIEPATDVGRLARAEFVCECASEDAALKTEIFRELGRVTQKSVVLATNTSYLDIDALGEASGRPQDVCGLHFFNPAQVMRLVEVVRGARTAAETVATALALARRMGKLPIVTGVCDGFVVNRVLARRSREAAFMLEEGATPAQIDRVLQDFGFPMGPYALADLAGIDVQFAARNARRHRLTERERAANFVDQLYERGRFGQKTGAGWYRYDENRKPQPDPEIDALLAAHSTARGMVPREFTDQEILERCLYAMVNEGAKLIDEGVVTRADEIDVAMVHGIGFPSYTGGPMWWADTVGLGRIRDAIHDWGTRDAANWSPAPLLDRLAAAGQRFYEPGA